MLRLGLISDTHDFLDPRIPELFAGVDHILHAGDVGMPWLLMQLEQIAPVMAVRGNCDTELRCRETEVLELAGHRILLQHQVDPRHPGDILRQRLKRHQPQLVVFGHTHRRFSLTQEGILYVNPGYAGKPRLNQARSVARLQWDGQPPEVGFIDLA